MVWLAYSPSPLIYMSIIRYLDLKDCFNALSDFAHYLNLLTFISDADPTTPNNDSIAGIYVPRPAPVHLLFFGAPSLHEGH